MNKHTLFLVIILTISTKLFAQKFYCNLGSGYNFSAAPTMPGYVQNESFSYQIGTILDSISLTKGTGSLGKGMQIKGTIGYMLNKKIGLELNASYFCGSPLSRVFYTTFFYDLTGYNNEKYTFTGRMLRLIPALQISTDAGPVKLYMKTGLVIGLLSKLKQTNKENCSGIHFYESEIEYSGGIPLGFNGTTGAVIKLNNRFSIYSEIDYIIQSWAPVKSEYIKNTSDNVDILSTMTNREKETIYVDNLSSVSSETDQSLPRKDVKKYWPFNSLGINLGLRVFLGK